MGAPSRSGGQWLRTLERSGTRGLRSARRASVSLSSAGCSCASRGALGRPAAAAGAVEAGGRSTSCCARRTAGASTSDAPKRHGLKPPVHGRGVAHLGRLLASRRSASSRSRRATTRAVTTCLSSSLRLTATLRGRGQRAGRRSRSRPPTARRAAQTGPDTRKPARGSVSGSVVVRRRSAVAGREPDGLGHRSGGAALICIESGRVWNR